VPDRNPNVTVVTYTSRVIPEPNRQNAGVMNTTYAQANDINATNPAERPWWTVRRSLLATLAVASLVLAAMLTPTPLAKWVFGEHAIVAISR